ncbi:MAG: hypothetical protein CME63_03800 [Halobacteriovoraceae bacterium]|nr:hypothetical protein [Halobacteriovoraceae bacterium]|tara:strand:- start:147813 stop:148343 length:531 start_codon:yes stop_codon:yes gene_type:complete
MSLVKKFSPSPEIYITQYKYLFEFLRDLNLYKNWNSIMEVGTARGDGSLYLRERFPTAHIETMEMPEPDEDHEIDLNELESMLQEIQINLHKIASPPEFTWTRKYEFCCIDVSSKAQANIKNYLYWREYIESGGVLCMVIPRSNEKKKREKQKFIDYLNQAEIEFTVVREFFIFPI